jgi:hypothetical protein
MPCTADCDRDKWQIRPLVREGAPHRQNRKCLTATKIWSWAPDWAWHQDWLAYWPSVVMWLWLTNYPHGHNTPSVKVFPALYGTRKHITVFPSVHHWPLSWARWIQSKLWHISLALYRLVLINKCTLTWVTHRVYFWVLFGVQNEEHKGPKDHYNIYIFKGNLMFSWG